MKKYTFLITMFLLVYCQIQVNSQPVYFPPKNSAWAEKSPEVSGIDPAKLEEAVNFASENEYTGSRDLRIAIIQGFRTEPYHELAGPVKKRGGPAGMILKNGYMVAKWGDLDRVDMTFSVTKSYLATVAGLAFDEGLISNVHEKVKDYVWDETFDGEHNSKITWEHLLTQSSDWSGDLFGMQDWADRPPREGGIDEWKNRKLNEPGTVFEYNDVRVNLMAYSLLQVWRKPLPQILKEKIMDPIGASSTWRWFGYENSWVTIDGLNIQSVSGGGHSGGGLFINTFDHARFGLLFMNNGSWNGKQLISKEWIDKSMKSSPANPAYGYMWWLNKGPGKIEGVSENMFYASGFGGNFIIVDREKQLVVVVRWLEPAKLNDFVKLVYQSLK